MNGMMKKTAIGAMAALTIGAGALAVATPASAQRFGGHGGGFHGGFGGRGVGAAALGVGLAAGALAGAGAYNYGYAPYGYETDNGYAPAYNAPPYGYGYPRY